nr:dynamin family protein [Myxococcus xanthus]
MAVVLKGARHRHFRLERKADVERRQQWHNERGHHVRVVPYGDSYDELPAFIESLRSPGLEGAKADPNLTVPSLEDVLPLARPSLSAGEYSRLQQKGREAVARLSALARQLGWESIGVHSEEISHVLEQELYRVAITGRSRAGKSSLVNALVGRSICPVERVITTAIPIIIGPGEKESATIKYQPNGRPPLIFDGPISADMLAPYADQRHNRGNEKRVDCIEVRLGHQVLDLGVEYVDIPGFDDPSGRIWSATQETIGEAHALVLVLDVSSYESGGLTIDNATREVLERARDRECPVLVVCNKADKLSRADQEEAKLYVLESFDRFRLRTALVHGPFFMSTREVLEARARSGPVPRPFSTFEAALWERLWNTEAVGLRRLFRVFDALRVADEEVDALIAARRAKGRERERLLAAFARCQQDKARILETCRHNFHSLRQRTAALIEVRRGEHFHAIAEYIESLPAGSRVPLVSESVQALQERLIVACRSIIENVTPSVTTLREGAEKAVARTLSEFREEAGLSAQARHARATLGALGNWSEAVVLPDSGDGERMLKVTAAGGGAGLAVFFALANPVGLLAAAGVGFGVSVLVDVLTDRADSSATLRARIEEHANAAFTSFKQSVDAGIESFGRELAKQVHQRMRPFLNDMERRLETMREPTADEQRWHAEMRETTADALRVLEEVLGSSRAVSTLHPPTVV